MEIFVKGDGESSNEKNTSCVAFSRKHDRHRLLSFLRFMIGRGRNSIVRCIPRVVGYIPRIETIVLHKIIFFNVLIWDLPLKSFRNKWRCKSFYRRFVPRASLEVFVGGGISKDIEATIAAIQTLSI